MHPPFQAQASGFATSGLCVALVFVGQLDFCGVRSWCFCSMCFGKVLKEV